MLAGNEGIEPRSTRIWNPACSLSYHPEAWRPLLTNSFLLGDRCSSCVAIVMRQGVETRSRLGISARVGVLASLERSLCLRADAGSIVRRYSHTGNSLVCRSVARHHRDSAANNVNLVLAL